jgi:hypothetical protein
MNRLRGLFGRAGNLLLDVVGTGQAPTDDKRPVGVISLIGGYGGLHPQLVLNCSREISRGKLKASSSPGYRHGVLFGYKPSQIT